MRQIRIGDITIDAVIEREGPWRRPQDFFPVYDEAVFRHHLPSMEPEVFDSALGMMVITYQTFVVRTPRYTILVDTCTGEDKGHPPPFDFPGKERWRNELFALGISFDKIDYVFCTHLHIDHTGVEHHVTGRPLGADVPECEIRLSQKGICGLGSGVRQGRQSARHGIP
jgi:glyoxylase-like metal-dependent hydrolase (beta-lactamase superfamily II)